MSETTAHEALADFLRRATPRLPALGFVFHVANESAGGAKTSGGIPLDVLKEKRMLAVPGVWDFMYIGANLSGIGECGAYHFAGVAIELKSTRAYRTKDQGLSDAQKAWRRHYIQHGWYTAVYPEERWPEVAQLFVAWVGGSVDDFDFGGGQG